MIGNQQVCPVKTRAAAKYAPIRKPAATIPLTTQVLSNTAETLDSAILPPAVPIAPIIANQMTLKGGLA